MVAAEHKLALPEACLLLILIWDMGVKKVGA